MGMPSITIVFKTQAAQVVSRAQKGVVALIIRDSKAGGPHDLTGPEQVPSTLGAANQAYVKRAFVGYVNKPRRVLLYVLSAAAEMSAALEWLATQSFDYLAATPDVTAEESGAIATWVKARRQENHAIYKAVLPNLVADSEAIVNFATGGIKVGADTYTAAQYCSRIAGLIAGTPMEISSTYAPLIEVSDVERLAAAEMDAAVDAGKLILFHDGVKVKTGRGVNSLTTTSPEKGDIFKKVKIVETLDLINSSLRTAIQDGWIGKYPGSYDSVVILISMVKAFLEDLERSGLLQAGTSTVAVDLEAKTAYLRDRGVDVSGMSEQELKEYPTGSKVFLAVSIRPLDAIEDVVLNVFM